MTSDDRERGKLDKEIDANLKRVYAKLLDEEVPDRFNELLQKLRGKESQE